jgi:hypothetical protein
VINKKKQEEEEFSDLDIALLKLPRQKRKRNNKQTGKKISNDEEKKRGSVEKKGDEKDVESKNERTVKVRKAIHKRKRSEDMTNKENEIVHNTRKRTGITKRIARKRVSKEESSDDDTPHIKAKRKKPNDSTLVRNVMMNGYLPPGIQPAQLAERDLYCKNGICVSS